MTIWLATRSSVDQNTRIRKGLFESPQGSRFKDTRGLIFNGSTYSFWSYFIRRYAQT